jgi:hypothetical protein
MVSSHLQKSIYTFKILLIKKQITVEQLQGPQEQRSMKKVNVKTENLNNGSFIALTFFGCIALRLFKDFECP